MYQSMHLTPADFDSTASEHWMDVFWGHGRSDLEIDSDLSLVLGTLDVDFTTAGRWPNWQLDISEQAQADVGAWKQRAKELLQLSGKRYDVELDFVKESWFGNMEWNDVVLIGKGQGRWIILYWYTTA